MNEKWHVKWPAFIKHFLKHFSSNSSLCKTNSSMCRSCTDLDSLTLRRNRFLANRRGKLRPDLNTLSKVFSCEEISFLHLFQERISLLQENITWEIDWVRHKRLCPNAPLNQYDANTLLSKIIEPMCRCISTLRCVDVNEQLVNVPLYLRKARCDRTLLNWFNWWSVCEEHAATARCSLKATAINNVEFLWASCVSAHLSQTSGKNRLKKWNVLHTRIRRIRCVCALLTWKRCDFEMPSWFDNPMNASMLYCPSVVCLSVYLSICISVYLSTCISVCLVIWPMRHRSARGECALLVWNDRTMCIWKHDATARCFIDSDQCVIEEHAATARDSLESNGQCTIEDHAATARESLESTGHCDIEEHAATARCPLE